jgi:hypothetical protein
VNRRIAGEAGVVAGKRSIAAGMHCGMETCGSAAEMPASGKMRAVEAAACSAEMGATEMTAAKVAATAKMTTSAVATSAVAASTVATASASPGVGRACKRK